MIAASTIASAIRAADWNVGLDLHALYPCEAAQLIPSWRKPSKHVTSRIGRQYD